MFGKALNIENLQTLVDLVEAGSPQELVAKYSGYQNLNPTTIRKRIRTLGETFGVSGGSGLYDFSAHRPTDAGESLLLDAGRILEDVQNAKLRLAMYNKKKEDFLYFGTTNTIADTFVPRALSALAEKRNMGDLYAAITTAYHDGLVKQFRERGSVHFLLLPGYVASQLPLLYFDKGDKRKKGASSLPEPDVRCQKILTEHLKIIVGRDHPLLHEKAITVSQLKKCKLMIKGVQSSAYTYVKERAGEDITVPGNFPFLMGDLHLIYQCVRRSLGVGIAAESTVEGSEDIHGLDLTRDDGTLVDLRRDIACLYYPGSLSNVEKEFLTAFQQANSAYRGMNRDIREVLWEGKG